MIPFQERPGIKTMIRSLEGVVLVKTKDSIVLDVHGLGFEIGCSSMALRLSEEANTIRLVTYLQISENGIALFGFANEEERDIFLKLTSIKGVGGKLALTVLRSLSSSEIVNAVVHADQDTFISVPGIGKKTAERICFELQRHFNEVILPLSPANAGNGSGVTETVISALRSLGFFNHDIAMVIQKMKEEMNDDFDRIDEGQMLKAALKGLNKNLR